MGNPGHNILELYDVLMQVQFAASITNLDIYYKKFGTRVASEVVEQLKVNSRIQIPKKKFLKIVKSLTTVLL